MHVQQVARFEAEKLQLITPFFYSFNRKCQRSTRLGSTNTVLYQNRPFGNTYPVDRISYPVPETSPG